MREKLEYLILAQSGFFLEAWVMIKEMKDLVTSDNWMGRVTVDEGSNNSQTLIPPTV